MRFGPDGDPVATVRAKVMGCRAQLTVSASPGRGDRLAAIAFERLRHLERCWSRFLPQSDVSRLNRADGRPVAVDPSTVVLLGAMATGVRATAGSFDPTLLTGVAGLGPASMWCRRGGEATTSSDRTSGRSWWLDETTVDADGPRICLPVGVQLDAGAIGKGLAADLVAAELMAGGATGARVVVGGDVRVVAPSVIAVRAPGWAGVIDHVAVADGGLATSGTGPSNDGAGRRRPVVDPRTGRPVTRAADADIVQVTVAAGTAVDAEVMATAILVDGLGGGDDIGDIGSGAGVLAVRADGQLVTNAAWRALRCAGDIGVAS